MKFSFFSCVSLLLLFVVGISALDLTYNYYGNPACVVSAYDYVRNVEFDVCKVDGRSKSLLVSDLGEGSLKICFYGSEDCSGKETCETVVDGDCIVDEYGSSHKYSVSSSK